MDLSNVIVTWLDLETLGFWPITPQKSHRVWTLFGLGPKCKLLGQHFALDRPNGLLDFKLPLVLDTQWCQVVNSPEEVKEFKMAFLDLIYYTYFKEAGLDDDRVIATLLNRTTYIWVVYSKPCSFWMKALEEEDWKKKGTCHDDVGICAQSTCIIQGSTINITPRA